ncbi:molecular chaperone EcpD [Pseudomonas brenneri]|nr:fimbria/pilus periplasmic chaperone [Pseudomonas sp. MF6787]OAE14588.1 molecular chaperone EcpD [Pseudomonas brenneri]
MAYLISIRQGMAAVLMSMVCCQVSASVVITGTRLIYPAQEAEITVTLDNNGALPVLVQTWVDSGDPNSSPTHSTAPFLLTPPVFRMDPNKGQSVRLMFTGASLPEDKESVYYFNLLEVPTAPAETGTPVNLLQMAFRSRIKIFYRPETLSGNASDAIDQVQWRIVHQAGGLALEGHNPTAFYVTVAKVGVVDGKQRFMAGSEMLAPRSKHSFALPTLKNLPGPQAQVELSAINDYGADVLIKRPLTP